MIVENIKFENIFMIQYFPNIKKYGKIFYSLEKNIYILIILMNYLIF